MANKVTVLIDVVTDRANTALGSFRTSIGEADGAVGKFKAGASSAMDSVKQNAGSLALAGGAALIAFGAKGIAAASSLEESMNAVDVTFGDAAKSIHALGETSVESFGLSQRAFNEAAVQFSAFAKGIAGPGGDVAGVMDDLMGRAVDFASVMNIDVGEAMALFQSTLAGETEPIRKYGKDVSAAAVEHFALSTGLIKSKSEMTEAIKVQARYGLLMEQTNTVAGDFANTQDGLANQQRILTAQIEDMQAQLGKHLVPALAQATSGLNEMMDAADSLGLIDAAFKFQEMTSAIGNTQRVIAIARGETDLFGRSVNDATDEQMDFVRAAKEAGLSSEQVKGALDAGVTSLGEYESSQDAVTGAVDRSSNRITAHTKAQEANAAAAAELKDDLTQAREALDKLTSSMITAAGKTLDLEKSELDLADATAASTGKVAEATAILNSSTSTDVQKAQALRDIRAEQISVAESSLSVAQAYANEKGAADGTRESARLQVEKLRELQGQYPNNAAAIQPYIDKLLAIPGVVDTEINADTRAANASLDGLLRKLSAIGSGATSVSVVAANRFRQYATGTDYHPGGMAIVGEEGPELVNLPTGSSVSTASETSRMLSTQPAAAATPQPSGPITLIIEGHPFRAMIADHEAAQVAQLRAGRR